MSLIVENFDKLTAIILMLSTSLYVRFLLQFLGQSWIKTVAHTATLTLLPILTYVITSVISGNIALSLGMVGALSIVRFRNPVRSPLELSVYFGAITMGITAAVSIKWFILLVGAVTAVCILLAIVKLSIEKVWHTPFFNTSFSEGNNLSSLVITTVGPVSELDSSSYLMTKMTDSEGITYTLLHASFSELQKIESNIQNAYEVKSVQLSR